MLHTENCEVFVLVHALDTYTLYTLHGPFNHPRERSAHMVIADALQTCYKNVKTNFTIFQAVFKLKSKSLTFEMCSALCYHKIELYTGRCNSVYLWDMQCDII